MNGPLVIWRFNARDGIASTGRPFFKEINRNPAQLGRDENDRVPSCENLFSNPTNLIDASCEFPGRKQQKLVGEFEEAQTHGLGPRVSKANYIGNLERNCNRSIIAPPRLFAPHRVSSTKDGGGKC